MNRVLRTWERMSGWPFGPWLFSRFLGRNVPYSGSIRAVVRELGPGHAVVTMEDKKRFRNHFNSIHAVALSNLGELASGLAMTAAMPSSMRGIVTRMDTEYVKKARGRLEARSDARPPDEVTEPMDHLVRAEIFDTEGDVVARVTVQWRLAPRA